MARVFTSAQTGAEIVVFSLDHCPPHVTARHRAENWVARIRFSFVTGAVTLWDVEPLKNAPRLRDINALVDEVRDEIEACRCLWWLVQGTVCLDNRWVDVDPAAPTLRLLGRRGPRARRIGSADYDVETGDLSVGLQGGAILRIAAGSGEGE